jgi:hypothetical protein
LWEEGGSRQIFLVPYERVLIWSKLLSNWPLKGGDAPVELSLDYYAKSITDCPTVQGSNRQGDVRKGLISAAIAWEVLLGERVQTEITFRLSQRGAILVTDGNAGIRVAERLRRLYGQRSALLHAGEEPTLEQIIQLQQFLMRALPSMVELSGRAGGYRNAIGLLDQAPYRRDAELERLLSDAEGWWAFVDVASLFTE